MAEREHEGETCCRSFMMEVHEKKKNKKEKKKIWRKVKHEFLMMATLPGLQEDGWRSSKHPGRRF